MHISEYLFNPKYIATFSFKKKKIPDDSQVCNLRNIIDTFYVIFDDYKNQN